MRFGKIILIGAGKVATDCTRFLCRDLKIGEVEVIESSENQFSMLERTMPSTTVVLTQRRSVKQWKEA